MTTLNEIDQIAELAWSLKRSGIDANREQINQLSEYGVRRDAPLYIAISDLLTSLNTYYRGNYDEAYTLGEATHQQLLLIGPPIWQGRMLYIMGLLSSSKGKLAEALLYWKEGLSIAERLADIELKGFLLYNLADLNRAIFKRYDIARDYYMEGLKLCHGKDKPIICGLMLMGLSRCELFDNKIELSLKHAERALVIAKESNDDRVIGICLEFAGSRYADVDNFEKALTYLLESLKNRTARQDLYGMVNSHCSLSACYLKKGDIEKSFEHIQRSQEIYLTLKTSVLDDLIYKQLAEVYEARKEWEMSSNYYRSYAEARNKSITKELEDAISMMAAEFQLELSRKETEILKQKHQELKLKNEEISQLALELEQALEDLKETQNELIRTSRLSGLLNLIVGVAHEINTPLGNSLMLLSFVDAQRKELENASMEQSPLTLTEMKVSIDHLTTNLNRVASIIESLKKFNISAEYLTYQNNDIKALLEEWSIESKLLEPRIQVDLKFDASEDYHCKYNESIYSKILNELLSNTLQHAYADNQPCPIQIELVNHPEVVEIVFTDFGCGMDIDETHDLFEPFRTLKKPTSGLGLGLHLVYLLVTTVQRGEVHLSATPELGTRVSIKLMKG